MSDETIPHDLNDFLGALTGARQHPILLTYGDGGVVECSDGADILEALREAGEAGGEALHLRLVDAGGEVLFVYTVIDFATENDWKGMPGPAPTVVMFNPAPPARRKSPVQGAPDILTPQPFGKLVIGYALEEAVNVSDEAIVRLAQSMHPSIGDLATAGLPVPSDQCRLVHVNLDAYTSLADLQAAAGYGRLGHAVMQTPFDVESNRLGREVTATFGKSEQDKNWKPERRTVGGILAKFCRHIEREKKEGEAVVLGALPPGERANEAVQALEFATLDLDGGIAIETIHKGVKAARLMASVTSTHSHGKTETTVKHTDLVKWMDRNLPGSGEITIEVIRSFLTIKAKLEPEIVRSATFKIVEGTKVGRQVVITHAPIGKWRVVVPLAKEFRIAQNGRTDKDARDKWSQINKALAKRLGDLRIDSTGNDANRLFYLPAHKAGAPWRADLFDGDLLDWETLLDETPADIYESLEAEFGTKRRNDAVAGPFSTRWAAKRAAGFQIADVIRDLAEDRVRGQNGDKLIIECPFDDEHSNAGDPEDVACMAVNAGDGPASGFVISCQHDSHKGLDRLQFLNRMAEDDWFAAEDAMADEYNALLDEDIREASTTEPTNRAAIDYALPKGFGAFEVTQFNGRKFFAFKGDDDDEGGLAFTRFSVIGGAVHPDRGGLRDLEIAYENETGEAETFRMDATKAATKAWAIGAMRGQGIAFGSNRGQNTAHNIIMATQPTNQIIRDRTGWLEDGVFMLPTGAVVGDDSSNMRLSDHVRIKAPPKAGTLEGWVGGAAVACESKSLSLKVAILAGLAGPLVALTGQGTLIINFAGTSSQGKTFRQQVGVSASGPVKPGVGQLQSANSTSNAMEIPLERGSGSITAYDELHLAPVKWAVHLIYTASGQQGRNRANNTGGQGVVRSWRGGVVTLSSEVGLAQRLQMEGERLAGGVTVRAIEISAAEGRLDPEPYERVKAMLTNYGHALPVVVQALKDSNYVERPELLTKRITKLVAELGVEPSDAMGYRSATGLAYLAVAGHIAQEAGLLPASFDPVEVAREVWQGMSTGELRAENPIDRAINQLVESLNKHYGQEVYDTVEQKDRTPTREVLAVVDEHQGKRVYVVRASILAKWSGGAADVGELRRALVDRGIAIPYVTSRSSGPVWDYWPKPIGRNSCLVLRADFIEGNAADRQHAA